MPGGITLVPAEFVSCFSGFTSLLHCNGWDHCYDDGREESLLTLWFGLLEVV